MPPQATPRVRIAAACSRLGPSQFVERCLHLLAGGDESAEFLVTLGGAPAVHLLSAGIPPGQEYWLRVWAARGLLWAGWGDDVAAIRVALADESWRVREMTCKVIARHHIGDLLEEVAGMHSDPVARVRAAAARAAQKIVEANA